jgi:F-type H+-transporting ATPase subunit b
MAVLLVSMICVIVIIFIILVLFMKRLIKRDVVSATSHLDNLTFEFTQKEEAIKKEYEELKRQSQEIIEKATKDAQTQKENILKQAEEEKNKVITQAQEKANEIVKQADNTRLALLAELQEKINEKAIEKAGQLLNQALSVSVRNDIHQRWVDDLISNSFQQLERLRIPEGISEIKVVTAFELNQKQRAALLDKIKERLGYDVKLQEEIDPDIIAGLVVNIGGLFLDGSLSFKIQEVVRGQQQIS